ncbi:MAG: hypothetical protein JWO44_1240 [Bacteroidetes bacterium]|nr:hypothetical protein [Bacteroidota bacterium]
MSGEQGFDIHHLQFNPRITEELQSVHLVKDLWPTVYILSDKSSGEAYVGETTDAFSRFHCHLKNPLKNKLTNAHLITGSRFNKSATLDIEANLIKYISGDGEYELANLNLGIANHNYYQKKEIYWQIFKEIWDKLRSYGIARHPLDQIDNSDLFKYSPYKTLSAEQKEGLLVIMKNLLNNEYDTTLIQGGAGTGKTILAIFLFKLLNTDLSEFRPTEFKDDGDEFMDLLFRLREKYQTPKMALVIPMSSFRATLKKVFANIKGLNAKMVIGPSEVANQSFDILMVDESHRLRRRINLGAYYGPFDTASGKLGLDKNNSTELDWIIKQSAKRILFYDESQSIKPSDVKKEDFDRLKAAQNTKIDYLKSQFRVKGGTDYVDFIRKLLDCSIEPGSRFFSTEYEFVLFDSLADMVEEIRQRNTESGLARLLAGYSWDWISKKDKSKFDIKINNIELQWNRVSVDWINSDNSEHEVGCIHTTQGYDLNYAAIIFGNEISYDKASGKIIIYKEKYFDKNGKNTITDPEELKQFILNIYKTLMLRGIKGTYIYACDRGLHEYFKDHIYGHKTEKSISFLPKKEIKPFENCIPYYDLTAAAGNFSENQTINADELEWLPLPPGYKNTRDLFACRIEGDSMNRVIPNGSICMFRKYSGGSRNGKIVLAELTNFRDQETGSRYTVKEYNSEKHTHDDDTWEHQQIVLKPLSYKPEYEALVLQPDEAVTLKIAGIFEKVLM